jgi:hypothetical protein
MQAYSEESLYLSRSVGDRQAMALALNALGIALGNLGEVDRSIALHEESAAISRELGDDRTLAAALNNLGYRLLRRGAYGRARALCEEGLEVCRRLGHSTGTSVVLGNLGLVALLEHRPDDSCAAFRQGLLHDRELGYTEGLIYGLAGTAAALAVSGRHVEAATILGAAQAAAELTGVKLELLESEVQAQATETLRQSLGEERFAQAHAAGGRALVMLVSTEGCPWCRLVRQSYLLPLRAEGQPVVEIDMRSALRILDFQGAPSTPAQLAQALRVRVAPTVLFLAAGGREAAPRIAGVPLPDFYGAYLQERVDAANRVAS